MEKTGDGNHHLKNPLIDITKLKLPRGRDRRLVGDEESRLLAAAGKSHAPTLKLCIQLAIETGMRAGEIVQLTWEQSDLTNSVIRVQLSKNGMAGSSHSPKKPRHCCERSQGRCMEGG